MPFMRIGDATVYSHVGTAVIWSPAWGSALRAEARLCRLSQGWQYRSLSVVGYESEGRVELPTVRPLARLVLELLGRVWCACARR